MKMVYPIIHKPSSIGLLVHNEEILQTRIVIWDKCNN